MSKIEKLMVLDVDGVLLNWCSGFDEWITKYKFKEPGHEGDPAIVNPNTYSLSDRYGIPFEVIDNYVRLFNNSLDFAYLPAIDDVHDALTDLQCEGDWLFHVVSSFSDDSRAQSARTQNLNDKFRWIWFDERHYLPLYSPKLETLKSIRPLAKQAVFIDDKPAHVIEGLEAGFDARLLLQPYNMNDPIAKEYGITWREIKENYS